LPISTSVRWTGRVTIVISTPDSASAEIAGEAIAEALSARTKLNMNMKSSKRALRSPEHSPHISNLHPERLGNLHVAHPAVAHHEDRGRAARQPTQDEAYLCPSFPIDHRVLRARQGPHDLYEQLALVAPPLPAKNIERRVHRGDPDPSSSLLVVAREPSVRGQEDILGDVLSALCMTDHAVGQAHDGPVMVAEERLEGRHAGAGVRLLPPFVMSRLQPHHPLSTAATPNVTPRRLRRVNPEPLDDRRHGNKPANPAFGSRRASHRHQRAPSVARIADTPVGL
jgi:hypothetical protein